MNSVSIYHFPISLVDVIESIVTSNRGNLTEFYSTLGINTVEKEKWVTLTSDHFERMMLLAITYLMGKEPISIQILKHIPTSTTLVGLLSMTAETLGDALDIAVKYLSIIIPTHSLIKKINGTHAIIHIHTLNHFSPRMESLLAEFIAGALFDMLSYAESSDSESIKHISEKDMSVSFSHDYTGDFRPFFNGVVRFNQPKTKIFFPLKLKHIRLRTRGKASNILLTNMLESDMLKSQHILLNSQKVQQVILQLLSHNINPGIDTVLSELATSRRTLYRRLAEEGTSYTKLLDSVKVKQAELLLANTTLPISKVAHQLFFNNITGFINAFKRVNNITPANYRSLYSMTQKNIEQTTASRF